VARVINEWFWEDLRGANGKGQQLETLEFLQRFANSTSQMVVVEESPFDHKAWALCSSKAGVRTFIGKAFFNKMRVNLDRCRMLKPEQLEPLPEQLCARVTTTLFKHVLRSLALFSPQPMPRVPPL
jgi:hypothetical protein